MVNRNKNNSIVFLTTLSVYLGLVLVSGAVSPVLAQAAMTRNFNVQDEIEVKDDLDEKPDDEKLDNLNDSIESYFKDVKSFVEDLQKLYSIEKFDTDYDRFSIAEIGFVPCNVDGDPVRHAETSTKIDNRWLEPAITDASYKFENWNFLSDCLKDTKFNTEGSTNSTFKISYDKSELKVEVSISKSSPQRAEKLAEKFNQSFKTYKIDEDDLVTKQNFKNTSFKSENNQVLIVTRLPRGSLDELLKQNAKAENQ